MLDIPQGVKDLFKTDGILKNIRVVFHFANGESRTICNDKILKESLRFEESLSSREEVKFGLCESSTISFDCVGLDNVKGTKIDVYVEIDVSSIINDDPEVAAVAQTSSDVPFEFYRLPLGSFIVDECKRDAKMLKRKVKGYSQFSDLPSYDWWTKIAWKKTTNAKHTINFDVINFIAATNNGFFDVSGGTLLTNWQQRTATGIWNPREVIVSKETGNSYTFEFDISNSYYMNIGTFDPEAPWPTTQRLGRLNKCELSALYGLTLNNMLEDFRSQGVEEDVLEELKKIIKEQFEPFNVFNAYKDGSLYNYDDSYYTEKGKKIKGGEAFILPPFIEVTLRLPVRYIFHGTSEWSTVVFLDDAPNNGSIEIYEINLFDGNRPSIPIVGEDFLSGYETSFMTAILYQDIRKLLESIVEVFGCFGKFDRYGYFKTITFGEVEIIGQYPANDLYPADDLYPLEPYPVVNEGDVDVETIVEDDMISNWYEEYNIKFGGITCNYYNSEILDADNNPTLVTYTEWWDDSDDVLLYELNDNEIIKNNTYTEAELIAFITPLINVLKIFSFCPSDLQCVGLPYIESGDWLFTAMQGNYVINLCLSRSMSGIQALRDKVKSD